jgi:hypothetical protein
MVVRPDSYHTSHQMENGTFWIYTTRKKADTMDDGSPSSKDELEPQTILANFLQRILAAARQLAREADGDVVMTDVRMEEDVSARNTTTPSRMLDLIAQSLVASCNVLHEDTSDLPHIREEEVKAYVYRRMDYLRRLLRACAPIAMEIAARLVSMMIHSRQDDKMMMINVYILLCIWTPLAPQIFPGVWSAFANTERCPLDDNSSMAQCCQARILVLLEGTYYFGQFVAVTKNQDERLAELWDWEWVIRMVHYETQFATPAPVHYYCHRMIAYTHRLGLGYLQDKAVDSRAQTFFHHPWDVRQEAAMYEEFIAQYNCTVIWDSDVFIPLPDESSLVEALGGCHAKLVLIGGLTFWVHDMKSPVSVPRLVMTETTKDNLRILARALDQTFFPAIVLSSHVHLVHYAAAVLNIPVLELFLDETTDIPSTLYGSTVPANGHFQWQWGVFATAMLQGHWVILHGMTMDWQAALDLVIRDGILTHSTKPSIRANFSFRLFGVVADNKNRLLAPANWYNDTAMREPTKDECLEIARVLHNTIPSTILEAVVQVTPSTAGLRHFLKTLRRVEQCLSTTNETTHHQYIMEHQRLLCAAECLDVYGMSEPDITARHLWLATNVAPAFGLTAELVIQFTEQRSETARITLFPSDRTFNGSTLRLLERLAVCVREQEPVLLVVRRVHR